MIDVNYKYLTFTSFVNMYDWSVKAKESIRTAFKDARKFKLSEILTREKKVIIIKDNIKYKRVTIRLYGKGVHLRDIELGKNIGTKKQFLAEAGQFIISRIDARNGALGIVPEDLDGAIITNDFWTFNINQMVNPQFLILLLSSDRFQEFWGSQSSGTTNRQRISEDSFLSQELYLPTLEIQAQIVDRYNSCMDEVRQNEVKISKHEANIDIYILEELGIIETSEQSRRKRNYKFLSIVSFEELVQWGVDKNRETLPYNYTKFKPISFHNLPEIYSGIFRGKSPIYSDKSNKYILNQKCNRWNSIQTEFAKYVDEKWLETIDQMFFTREGDILINSTGEGTIGRASVVGEHYTGLLFDSHILLLRVNKKYINPLFWVSVINSSFGQNQINLLKGAQATKQTELGIENVKKLQMPLPSLEIQNGIANKVLCIREEINDLYKRSEILRKQAKKEFEEAVFSDR